MYTENRRRLGRLASTMEDVLCRLSQTEVVEEPAVRLAAVPEVAASSMLARTRACRALWALGNLDRGLACGGGMARLLWPRWCLSLAHAGGSLGGNLLWWEDHW